MAHCKRERPEGSKTRDEEDIRSQRLNQLGAPERELLPMWPQVSSAFEKIRPTRATGLQDSADVTRRVYLELDLGLVRDHPDSSDCATQELCAHADELGSLVSSMAFTPVVISGLVRQWLEILVEYAEDFGHRHECVAAIMIPMLIAPSFAHDKYPDQRPALILVQGHEGPARAGSRELAIIGADELI